MIRTREMKALLLLLVGVGAFACADAGEADLQNEEFRVWCGESACAWTVDQGKVERVPTWHRKVYGIGLTDDPTRISQVLEMENVRCLFLTLLADVDDAATLYWEIDYYNDDIDAPEHTVKIAVSDWETTHREASVPEGCTEARIILRKTGRGRAVVAKADISGNVYCAAEPPSGVDPLLDSDCGPDGGLCEE